ANRVVFRQGEVGTSWYIIVSGSVNVLVSAPGKTEDSIVVATKVAGEGFGELALVNDAPRAASILTACPCVLLRVEKVDYNRILRFVHNKEQKEKVFFLRKVPIFVHFTYGNLTAIANVMTMRTYSVGSYVITEGTPINKMHFVKSGKCEILKTLRLSNGATVQVPLGTLENGEYIGEAGVLCD
ncbi:cyclic nucleotide-binding-like protein, partial [Cladochytrium replicatum]